MSETRGVRSEVLEYCIGNGVDVGYGGDPIVPTAITIDQPSPYVHYGDHPQNLKGDGADLVWFKDDSLDYVYSSHLIEDFPETAPVLREWLRVLAPGGYLILVAPVERLYREHCVATGGERNTNHKIEEMSANYMIAQLDSLQLPYEVVKRIDVINIYSFILVVQKPVPGPRILAPWVSSPMVRRLLRPVGWVARKLSLAGR